jgi:hypothetical protein
MSRGRFHSIKAIGEEVRVKTLEYFGIGWDGYDESKTVQENIDNIYPNIHFDVVIAYKPLEMKSFKDIKFLKCIRYNEMYDHKWTDKEIKESGCDIVICHHQNDYFEYLNRYKDSDVCFYNIPHCADKNIFYDQGGCRPYDVLLVGAYNVKTILGDHYPLRNRMSKLMAQLPPKYKTGIYSHVGYNHEDAYTDKYQRDFANVLNGSKIIITDSGAPRSRFAKYVEIPMSGALIASDLPNEQQEEFMNFICEIRMDMTDKEILDEIIKHLEDKNLYEFKRKLGLKYASNYTHEYYSKRFVNIIVDYKKEN